MFKGFNLEKPTFGFIERKGDEDLFVHKSEIKGIVKKGDSVEFLIGPGNQSGSIAAKNVRKIA